MVCVCVHVRVVCVCVVCSVCGVWCAVCVVCAFVWCVCMRACVCCMGVVVIYTRGGNWVYSLPPPHFLETWSLTEVRRVFGLDDSQFAGVRGSHNHAQIFDKGAGDPNSEPHACAANTHIL